MGKEDDAKCFYEKGQAYHSIFDKEKGWFRPRKADGAWVEWPENARLKEWYGCIEATLISKVGLYLTMFREW